MTKKDKTYEEDEYEISINYANGTATYGLHYAELIRENNENKKDNKDKKEIKEKD